MQPKSKQISPTDILEDSPTLSDRHKAEVLSENLHPCSTYMGLFEITARLVYLVHTFAHFTNRFAWQHLVQRSPPFQSAVSTSPSVQFQCSAVNVRLLLTIFKEGAVKLYFNVLQSISGFCSQFLEELEMISFGSQTRTEPNTMTAESRRFTDDTADSKYCMPSFLSSRLQCQHYYYILHHL